MLKEVCFLIGRGDAILYADASASPTALPDSRARWDAIWAHRDELDAIVHSHPLGPAAFSYEDLTTMAALDSALGRSLRYSVVTPRIVITRVGDGPVFPLHPEPWWVGLVRLASGLH